MRYMLKFTKQEEVKFTSHLDMVRMFKRAFQRSGLRLVFSEGFNPHPKMTLAQPLSLGYTSVGEWMEFETQDTYLAEEMTSLLTGVLPKGIQILEVKIMEPTEKSLASRCTAAEYTLALPLGYNTQPISERLSRLIEEEKADEFLSQQSIMILKKSVKHKSTKEIDIKSLIHWIQMFMVDNNMFLTTELAAGSSENLSPEYLLEAWMRYYEFHIPRERIEIIRTDLIL